MTREKHYPSRNHPGFTIVIKPVRKRYGDGYEYDYVAFENKARDTYWASGTESTAQAARKYAEAGLDKTIERERGFSGASRDRDMRTVARARAHGSYLSRNAVRVGRDRAGRPIRRPSGAPSYYHADETVRVTPSYVRAEALEQRLAKKYPKLFSGPIPENARTRFQAVARAWEKAHFYGWADNYREALRRGEETSRDASRSRARKVPPPPVQRRISKKIDLLRREGYPERQAIAVAYKMEAPQYAYPRMTRVRRRPITKRRYAPSRRTR